MCEQAQHERAHWEEGVRRKGEKGVYPAVVVGDPGNAVWTASHYVEQGHSVSGTLEGFIGVNVVTTQDDLVKTCFMW